MELTELARRIDSLAGNPLSAVRAELPKLLPDLTAAVTDPDIDFNTRVNLVTRARRLLDPKAERIAGPRRSLRELHHDLGIESEES